MVDGGVWRRPGPSLSAREGLEGMGRTWEGMTSPGSTRVCEAIGRRIFRLAELHLCLECRSVDRWEWM